MSENIYDILASTTHRARTGPDPAFTEKKLNLVSSRDETGPDPAHRGALRGISKRTSNDI